MTFPNDMHRHPKIKRLPVEVRWVFVEMNGEARIADNDGRFLQEDAEFLWEKEHLEALLASHPTRPLLVRDGTDYVLREFAKHQQTRDEREAIAERNRENGKKGGRPRKNPSETDPKPTGLFGLPSGKQVEPKKTYSQSQSQSQSQSYQTTSYVTKSQSLDNRAREKTDELSHAAKTVAAQFGVDVERIQGKIFDQLGIALDLTGSLGVATHVLSKRATPPDKPTAYVLSSITRNPAEIEKHIYDSGLA